MKVHTLMHVPYEGLGCIEDWIKKEKYSLSYTKFYEEVDLPKPEDVDMLIVMGGPMSVYEEEKFPWLKEEKAFIRQCISSGKKVLGICLGSQLLAEVLGAKVYPNHHKEIGWFDIFKTEDGKQSSVLNVTDDKVKVFHWHGDTYDLPVNSVHLFESKVCLYQAFLFDNRVLGLQFHFEVTKDSLTGMVENGVSELVKNDTVQTTDEILDHLEYIEENNRIMHQLLDKFILDK